MESTEILPAARTAVEIVGEHLTDILSGLSGQLGVIEGSVWSARDAAVHLACTTTLYAELAAGVASPLTEFTPQAVAHFNTQRLGDIAAADPVTLAKLLTAAVEEFVRTTAHRAESTPIAFHGGIAVNLGQLTGILLNEFLLHGYDIARTIGTPWPINPAHAALALYSTGSLNPHLIDPTAAHGHTATYRLELGMTGATIMRFTNGRLDNTESNTTYDTDCVITSDPVTFLLVSSGRLSQWPAITLGLLSASGPRADLAACFGSLFHRF